MQTTTSIADRPPTVTAPVISYGRFEEAWKGHHAKLSGLVEMHGAKRLCDIGGGANPVLTEKYVAERGLDYTLLDISQEELDKAPPQYHKVRADICRPDTKLGGGFDLAFSKMLAEHVRDGEAFHSNVRDLLRPGGRAFHFYPTLYSPPFVANWLMPERLSSALLDLFAPRDRVQHGKFPALYSWCRGPIPSHIRRLEKLGYAIDEFRGFFGHAYYRRIPVARQISEATTAWLQSHPVPHLTTFAFLVLRRV
jgi:SAM-dependent methyltransferase